MKTIQPNLSTMKTFMRFTIFTILMALFLFFNQTVKGQATFETYTTVSSGVITDDAFNEVDITSAFSGGIKLGSTTYTSMFIGSNGFVTFGQGFDSYSSDGIAGFNWCPMVAAQFDDIDPSQGGSIYYSQYSDYVVVTYYQIVPYSAPVVGSGNNTFQIILRKGAGYDGISNFDFQIEVRYIDLQWSKSGSAEAPPSAGWTIGGGVYGQMPFSGSSTFTSNQSYSNIGDPGVYKWDVIEGTILSAPTVTTQAVTSIGSTTVTGNGTITALGSSNATAYGVCWNTIGTPTTSDSQVNNGAASATGIFTASMTGLTAGTTYYVRAYATNATGTSYGSEVSFTTERSNLLDNPGAELDYASWAKVDGGSGWGITGSAYSGSKAWASSYGVCTLSQTVDLIAKGYAPSDLDLSIPIYASAYVASNPAKPGNMDIKVELLNASDGVISTYFICNESLAQNIPWTKKEILITGYLSGLRKIRYVIYGTQTGELWAGQYGPMFDETELSFKKVTTKPATQITLTSATLNSTVFTLGLNSTVKFDYGTTSGVYTNSVDVTDVSGTDANVVVSGLSQGTSYFARAVMTNSTGTFYGEEISFKTKIQLAITDPVIASKSYDGNTTATISTLGTLSGIDGSDDVSVSPAASFDDANAGTGKTITISYSLSGANMDKYIVPENTVLNNQEIIKAVLTATADNQTKVYGEANPTLTFQYSGWVNGVETIDTPLSISTTVDETSEVDTYANSITLSGGSDNNYTFNLISGNFEITKAMLTVTADNQTKAYGANNPTLTLQYSGWVNEDDKTVLDTKPTATTTVDTGTNIGTYPNSITVSGGIDDNYDFAYVSADFEVTKAILTVTADDQTKAYGAANPSLTFEYSGWVNGVETIDTPPTISTTVDETTAIGNHIGAITVSGAVDDNYLFNYVPGDFEITKSVLTVTAQPQVKEYGEVNPALTFSYSGWIDGVETIDVPPTIYTNVDKSTTAGIYVDAIQFYGGSDDHYTFNFVLGAFEVYKASLLVSADQQTKVYGEENPELTYSVTGWKNSDNLDKLTKKPEIGTIIDKTSAVENYKNAITVAGGYDVNYVFTYTQADFDVTKAPLTITAQSINKCFDGAAYAGTNQVTYNGFVNNEDQSVLEGSLQFNGTFASATVTGTYTIVPEGLTSENYDILYQNGSLVINPLPTTAISGDAEICAGSTGMIKVELTGQAPWSLTYTDGITSETVTDIYEPSYLIGVTIPENTSKTYTITSVTDFNGCSNTAQGSATIKSKSATSAGEISSDQLIAPGTLPTPIASVKPGSGSGSITYAWESSVDNGLNWEIIPEANEETYAPEIPEQTIWFRRIAISSENNVNCASVTNLVKISLWPTGVNNQESSESSWSAYAVRNTEIRLKADVGSSAIARLYDIQGRLVLVKNLKEGSLNIIPTPTIKTGIYMLFVKENERIHGFKIPVRE